MRAKLIVDVGRYETKILLLVGDKHVKDSFLSLYTEDISKTSVSNSFTVVKTESNPFTIKPVDYKSSLLFGEDALSFGTVGKVKYFPVDVDKMANHIRLAVKNAVVRLILAGMLEDKSEIDLYLPLVFSFKDFKDIKAIEGKHMVWSEYLADGKGVKHEFAFTSVTCFSQGYSAIFSKLREWNVLKSVCTILDIGYATADFVCTVNGTSTFGESLPYGISRIMLDLKEAVARHGIERSEQALDDALRRGATKILAPSGDTIDIFAYLPEIILQFCSKLSKEVSVVLANMQRIPDINKFMVCGSGALLVGTSLKKYMPNLVLAEDCKYANCDGIASIIEAAG